MFYPINNQFLVSNPNSIVADITRMRDFEAGFLRVVWTKRPNSSYLYYLDCFKLVSNWYRWFALVWGDFISWSNTSRSGDFVNWRSYFLLLIYLPLKHITWLTLTILSILDDSVPFLPTAEYASHLLRW